MEKGSIFVYNPADLKGHSAVRTRFVEAEKPDEFIMYIPAMRRIRRLAGSDTQDPLVGADAAWEDWKCWWQKLSSKIWPSLNIKLAKEKPSENKNSH